MGDTIDAKSGEQVLDVLISKHLPAVIPEVGFLEDYSTFPTRVLLDISCDTIEKVAKQMCRAAGPGGVEAIALQHWILCIGKENTAFRKVVAAFTSWMANDSPPWAAYRTFMSNFLVELDKCPCAQPLCIYEV